MIKIIKIKENNKIYSCKIYFEDYKQLKHIENHTRRQLKLKANDDSFNTLSLEEQFKLRKKNHNVKCTLSRCSGNTNLIITRKKRFFGGYKKICFCPECGSTIDYKFIRRYFEDIESENKAIYEMLKKSKNDLQTRIRIRRHNNQEVF